MIDSFILFQLIASAALYLAGKLKDDPNKIRDVINVTHNTLNRGKNCNYFLIEICKHYKVINY